MYTCFSRVPKVYSIYKRNFYHNINKSFFYRKEVVFPLVIFAIVMGMRYDVGTDYNNYFVAYIGLSDENDRFEIGYRSFVWLCHLFDFHYVVYFSIAAFFPIFFYYKAFERQVYLYPLLTIFLFVNNEYWNWMNVMRCSISICLFVYAVNFIASHDYKKYYLYSIIALLFHTSAVLLFFIYPLFRFDIDYLKNRYVQLAAFIFMFVLAAGFEALFFKYADIISFYQVFLGGDDMSYSSYSLDYLYDEMGNQARSNTGLVKHFKNIVWLLIIYYSTKMKTFYRTNKFVIIYTLFFLGSFINGVIPEGAISLARPFRFFGIFQTIIYAYFLYFLRKQKKDKLCQIIYIGLLVAFFVIFYMNMALSGSKAHIWYQFFWDNPRG